MFNIFVRETIEFCAVSETFYRTFYEKGNERTWKMNRINRTTFRICV